VQFLSKALRWLAPSAAAASGGAVAAGLYEGIGVDGVLGVGATAGFVAIIALPILLALSAVVRGLWIAWQPHELGLVEEDGRAPRLAAWLGVIWIALLLLGWSMMQGTWLLAKTTAFKPLTLSFAEPVLAMAAAFGVFALSRPLARVLTFVMRKVDARWKLTPVRIVTSLAINTVVIGYLIWRFVVKRRIGPIDLSLLHAPLIAMLGLVVVHALWSRIPRRIVGPLLGIVALGVIAMSITAWRIAPNQTLAIWGERPLAGLSIDALFDLDKIRARVSLANFKPTEKPAAEHPDIILVTIDTVRADHTPPYGGSAEMPLLRDLAAKGAVFEWAFSPSNVTRRSIPSMVTGLAPNRVRGRVVGWALRVDPRHVLLAERMQAGGYDTAGFVCCYGFWGADFRTGLQRGLQHLEIEPNGMKLAKAAQTWLAAREKQPGPRKPLFLWMHILEPHNWQQGTSAPKSEDEWGKFYDRALTASDAMIVELLGGLAERPPERAPIVIVTADHGEGLGEHGHPYHSTDLYNSQIRVPLVIAGPGIKPSRIPETVSLTELTPTILELGGFEVPQGNAIDGKSFADLATGRRIGQPNRGVAFAAMIRDRSNPGGISAIVKGEWKLIDNGDTPELYRLSDDPNETHNLISLKPQVYEDLRKRLKEFLDAGSKSPFD
jgi:arylsulfatase A-like enzyme